MGFLGVDIGGTKVALRAVDDLREPYEITFRWPEAGGVRGDLDTLARHVESVRTEDDQRLEAVGIAMPGTLDATGRVVAWPSRPTWVGLDFGSWLGELLPDCVVRWADDGDLAALAEARSTACENLLYVGVGTGIGGGVVLGGRLCPGPSRGSCELGHILVDRFGPPCDCGRRGCVQAVASGPACLRHAARLRGRDVTPDELRGALAARDDWAVSAVEESCAALAVAVTSVTELLHPDEVRIGGGFATALSDYTRTVAGYVDTLARPGHPAPPVEEATLHGLSSLTGAVLLARGEA